MIVLCIVVGAMCLGPIVACLLMAGGKDCEPRSYLRALKELPK